MARARAAAARERRRLGSSPSLPQSERPEARTARTVDLELDDGTTLPATILEVNPSGMALVAIDPKQLAAKSET